MAPPYQRYLSLADIHLCQQSATLLQLFNKLGYHTEPDAVPLPIADIGFAPADAAAIKSLCLPADHGGLFQVVLFELQDVALSRLRSLAANVLSRGTHITRNCCAGLQTGSAGPTNIAKQFQHVQRAMMFKKW